MEVDGIYCRRKDSRNAVSVNVGNVNAGNNNEGME